MALLTSFVKQSCVWRRPEGHTVTGAPVFSAGEEIVCRWVRNVRRFTDEAGEASATTVDVYTLAAVEVGDRLEKDGVSVTVRTVKDYVGFGGQDEGRRVSCS